MVLMLEELAAITRVHPETGEKAVRKRTLERLGFGAGFASPRYAAARPPWPSRRRDSVASEWHPL